VSEQRPVAVAVVGLGWWGRTVTAALQARSVANRTGSGSMEVVLGIDPSPAAVAACAELGIANAPDLSVALADPGIEAVILCTPHELHAAQIIAAARAGKHVFCEKPLCTRAADLADALAAVSAAGVQLGVGHERRFEPAVLELHRRFAAGEFGTALQFEGNFSQDKFFALAPDNWRLSAEQAPVGPLSATGIHLVDLAILLLGRPTQVWARLSTGGSSFANGDTLAITIGFASGATALISAVLATPFVGRVMLLGSSGWFEIRDRSHPERPSGWDVTSVRRDEEPVTRFFPPHEAVADNLAAFAQSVRAGGGYPIPVEQMSATVRTFEAITRSVSSGAIEEI